MADDDDDDCRVTTEMLAAFRDMIKFRLMMWDASRRLEKLIGKDVDADGDAAHMIASGFDSPETADQVNEADFREFMDW